MIIRRYVTTASVVCSLAFGLTGSAFADTVTIDTTGPHSTQKVEINNSSSTDITNDNTVHIVNGNFQEATSGSVKAEDNTSIGGGVGSGNASNNNAATTAVAISNGGSASVTPAGGGNGGGGAGGAGGGGGTGVTPGSGAGGGVSAAGSTPGMGAGSVLGASTSPVIGMGAGTLPEVGASVPMDVSALRAALLNQSKAPAANLSKASGLFTNFMLIVASLLSLVGAAGSAWYTKRRELKA